MEQSIHNSNDGSHTVFSSKFGAHYHSVYGAIEESIHVFISAGIFFKYNKGSKDISIFEMGFGTGLNAYLSIIESQKLDITIDYHSIESDPVVSDIYNKLNYPEVLNQDDPSLFTNLHTSPWENQQKITPHFNLTKYKGDIQAHKFGKQFDIIFFDAFAPSCQAHLWQKELHQKLFDILKPNGILVTYCTQGAFKRLLKSMGYKLDILNGPAKKREMVRAIKSK
ncbi:MAG: tRNA (5-methylaminomethyl-2-thiouridine)(34)-methyltransferase MnmD [Saprospiraceae bacterium]|nr:tRNA (5-methylaminomethyl-2-thiouridine)(34)-methyltransferase MnmD [Bacteroidia bacterium]NNE16109.1 tRNA (5-methylaminomethyl-2-thiouridine)(34)-methyltransferase MnmD [Saprospiraceae bacterium]NNL91399.1 tRNA (5-methylaminomethyl-2-thiouridine)(34)-methyltransferase MnmD [Saprospiraceae bacterium]